MEPEFIPPAFEMIAAEPSQIDGDDQGVEEVEPMIDNELPPLGRPLESAPSGRILRDEQPGRPSQALDGELDFRN
jgi:hypothetical protein